MVNIVRETEKYISKDLLEDYSKMYKSCAIVCSAEHMKVCPCQDDLIEEELTYRISKDSYRVENNLDSDQCKYRDGLLRDQVIVDLGRTAEKVGLECPVEADLIFSTIYRFDKRADGKYDLSDPDVFIILKSMINNMLSAHRMQLYSRRNGIVQTHIDREGNVSFTLNPVETAKLAFDKAQVDAVEKLNRIVFGNKNVNYNIKEKVEGVKSIPELMADIRLMKDTDLVGSVSTVVDVSSTEIDDDDDDDEEPPA
jgi:hypothetical protein